MSPSQRAGRLTIVSTLLLGLLATSACPGDDASGGDSGTDGTAGTIGTGASTADTTDGLDSGSSGSDTGVAVECDPNADASAWLDSPASEQLAAIEAGEVCCLNLLLAYGERLESDPDALNAMVSYDPEAPANAMALDDAGGAAGPLRCLVLAVKDNIDVAGMANTAGSLAMVDNFIDTDAPSIAGLRGSGALVIGKANLSEWANYRGSGSTSGWSSFGGQTKNGAYPSYNPCGSSSGSAAAVAAHQVAAAIGTETSGSIVCPSSVNGVVGFKPTVGLVSRTGIIPIADSFDTAGPITRTVRDAALVLGAMAGPDPGDPATAAIPADFDYDFASALDDADLGGKRLGYSSAAVSAFSGTQIDLFNAERGRLEAAGVVMVDVALPDEFSLVAPQQLVMATEFKAGLNAYLAAHVAPGVPASLSEIIAFNDANAATVMPYFGQERFLEAEGTAGLDDPAYLSARDTVREAAGAQGLLALLDGNDLDALVLPTAGPAWMTNYGTGDVITEPINARIAAAAGYPHLTVPMGEVSGRPVGMSFIGRPWEDGEILSLGHAYEQLP